MRNRTRLILAASFLVVFAAGVAAGLAAGFALGVPAEPGPRGRGPGSWLARELDLTEEQRQQMREIWSGALGPTRDRFGERREALEQRRQAVRELLTEEQEERYEEIVAEYEHTLREMREQRREAFERAVERTKEILDPDQREKYESMLERMHQRTENGPPGPPSRD